MRRAAVLGATLVAAGVLAPQAAPHGSVRPTVATPGGSQEFVFFVANARDVGIVGYRLELPEGARVEEVVAKQPGWTASATRNRVEWRGGRIPARSFDTFALRARMPDREGTVSFVGRELFPDGPGPPFRLDVVLAGGAGVAGDARDEGARTLGKAALFISLAAAVLAAAGFFLGLGRWLKGAG